MFGINFFNNTCVIHIKISKDSCAKYYQENKERLQRRTRERYQNLSIEERGKRDNKGVKDKKMFLNMKSKD